MKLIKKIAAIMLSIMMVLGMASVVSASEGDTGNGTITITNAIAGQTYKIYQILELESFSGKPAAGTDTGNYAYKVAAGWDDFITTGEGRNYLEIKDGYVKWKGATDDARVAEFAKEALAYATSEGLTATGEKPATTTTVEFTNLALGYYLVDSSAGTLCSLDTTDTDVTIREKNGVPSVEKKVQEDSTNAWGDSNTADIGQTVNFQTTITAQQGAQKYVLHDKMAEGLTFDGTVTVTKGDTTLASPIDYSLITDGANITDGCTFEIVFTQEFCDTLEADDQIIVTYSATLNENAVIAGEGNKNTTKLTYGDSSETTTSTTTTKTYSIPVFKYTGTDTPLENAKFELKRAGEATAIALIKKIPVTGTTPTYEGDIYRVAKNGETGTVTEVTTPASGKFKIEGLDADTYYLTETKQPDGYNKLSAPITVVIDENGNITVDRTTVNEVKVENNTGSILPSTGGSGTTMIYILGAILVLGSSVVLITKKRMR